MSCSAISRTECHSSIHILYIIPASLFLYIIYYFGFVFSGICIYIYIYIYVCLMYNTHTHPFLTITLISYYSPLAYNARYQTESGQLGMFFGGTTFSWREYVLISYYHTLSRGLTEGVIIKDTYSFYPARRLPQ